MNKVLPLKFFQSRNTVKIAKSLLGKFLVRRHKGKTAVYIITEVEAYDGFKDKASHAHRGKTERNKIMFGEAGHWYVYFTYGVHWLLNIVTGPRDYPAAILLRGIAKPSCFPQLKTQKPYSPATVRSTSDFAHWLSSLALSPTATTMPARSSSRATENKVSSLNITLIDGPAKLTKALKIDGKLNGQPASKKSGLWIAAPTKSERASPNFIYKNWAGGLLKFRIKKGPRIGVDYAGPIWSKKSYRFWLTD